MRRLPHFSAAAIEQPVGHRRSHSFWTVPPANERRLKVPRMKDVSHNVGLHDASKQEQAIAGLGPRPPVFCDAGRTPDACPKRKSNDAAIFPAMTRG